MHVVLIIYDYTWENEPISHALLKTGVSHKINIDINDKYWSSIMINKEITQSTLTMAIALV
jgi:hypothetical protein